MKYDGPDRRSGVSEEDALRIAKLAAKQALEDAYDETMNRVYADLGRAVVQKALVVIGAAVIGFLAYAKAKGWI